MKRIFNYCTMLLVSVLALSLGSCTEEYEYTPAVAEGEQVYFSNALSSTVELNPNESSVQIPVNRIQRSGELTVPLTVSLQANSKFKVSSDVTFADGDSVAYITLNYNPADIEYGQYETITVAIQDAQYTTPYGESSFTFEAGLSEWKTMTGNASFRDGIVASLYGLNIMTYQVEIQENVIVPGKYRIMDPYGEGTKFYEEYVENQGVFTLTGNPKTSIVIDATDPDFVYVDGDFYTGLDDGMASAGQGPLHVMSFVSVYLADGNSLEAIKANVPEIFGKLENGVISFPENCLVANFDDSTTPMYYANSADLAIALPGSEITDYSSSFTYTGRFTDVANNNYAQGIITLGADVASAKYLVAADGDDVQEIVNAVNNGEIEATQITESGEVKVPISESGKYNMIVITYDATGNMRGNSATSFTFTIGGGDDTKWEAYTSGTYDQNYMPNFVADENNNLVGNPFGSGQYSTTLYVDAEDENHYKIEPWLTQEGVFEFTINEGYITFNDIDTGVDAGNGYGNVFATSADNQFPGQGPFSGVTEEGYLAFGIMYYFNYKGEQGWMGGATELFMPSTANVPAMIKRMDKSVDLKHMLTPRNFKKSSKQKMAKTVKAKAFNNSKKVRF